MPSRLKLIELQGFKTFASRTDFVFSDTITAIVGPNGSGKSNIADAIRWVLGEQSYSLLRAKKTEDMIFSGSEHRSRAGMALANIVFDNSDGWLPIDFSEVAITRRAYRDGQNEYLINGQRVRLKDIGELLAQSGLSERTYTIIGQGLVDAALALKAEERRRLFEEAAGVGLHRARREEALRRLDTTRRNLERVQDILVELSPRLRSLERQAKRVEEYERVKADLHVLLRDWYGYHWHRSQKELTEAQTSVKSQDRILQKAREKQDHSGKQMTGLAQEIQKHREMLSHLHNQLSDLHSQREKLTRELVVIEERIRSFSEQYKNIQLEISRIEEEVGFQIELMRVAEKDSTRLNQELVEAQTQVSEAYENLRKTQDERKQVEQTVQNIQQAIGALTAQQSHIRARINERSNLIEEQKNQLEEIEQNLIKSRKIQDQIQIQIKNAEEILDGAQRNLKGTEQKLQTSLSKLQSIESMRRENLDSRTQILTNISRIETQLDVLAKAEMNYTGYAEGAKILMQASEKSTELGVLGILSSQMEVSANYERAIAAALGEFLDAVLLNDLDQLEKILDLMLDEHARGSILSINHPYTKKGKRHSDQNDNPAYIAFASDLVKVPKDLQDIVDFLLQNTIVVESRKDAQQWISFLKVSNGQQTKVVTLQGEVFFSGGQIIAGQEQRSGTLSRSRERRELQIILEKAMGDLKNLEKLLTDLEEQILSERGVETLIRDELKKNSAIVQKAQDDFNRLTLDFENNQRNIRFLQENNARLNQEIDRHLPEIDKMHKDLSQIDQSLEESKKILRDRRTELSILSTDDNQTQLSHWQTRLAVIQQSFSDSQQKIFELQPVIHRAEQTRESLLIKLDEFQEQSDSLVDRKQEITRDEEQLETGIQSFLSKIKPIEHQLASFEKDYAQIQIQESESRQMLTLAEHQNAQARIVLARRQEALDSLRRRIEDDFGLVAFRYEENISGPTPLPLDGLVENLPFTPEIPNDLEENVKRYRAQLRRIGPVNPEIHAEYIQVRDRFIFLNEQVTDLKRAEEDLKEVIAELDLLMEREFHRTFEAVAREFRQIFSRLFGGGSARLVLTDPDDLTDTGIDIEARLPGRREQGLSLLSGGERSLTAAALVFSLLKVSPTPFCVLDEVDAMLDEANVGRYRELLRELSSQTQFVVITHNRNTVQAAEVIYGVTMGSDSTSQVISLKLDDVPRVV